MPIKWLYLKVDILLTCGKDLHDPIHSLSGEDWTHKTSLTPSFFYLFACSKPGK